VNAARRFEGKIEATIAIGWCVFFLGSLVLRPWFPEWSGLLQMAGYGAFALLIVFLVVRWRIWFGIRQRRARRNQCMECGYSRAGLEHEAACPECSTKPSTSRSPSSP
jgi:hypothetical protein